MTTSSIRRRLAPLFLIAALAAGLLTLAPASPAHAASAATIRAKIVKSALGQIGQAERPGNFYPIRYKTGPTIQRPAAWCGVFTHWAWLKGGATKRPNMAGTGKNQGHWATYWQKWGQANNRWKPIRLRTPVRGDVVVYGNFPDSVHVGVVVDVRRDARGRATDVRTVEGNVGDKVTDLKWRKITQLSGRGKRATGFVSPV